MTWLVVAEGRLPIFVGGDGGEQGTCWSYLGFVLPKIFKIKIFESWWFDMVDMIWLKQTRSINNKNLIIKLRKKIKLIFACTKSKLKRKKKKTLGAIK